MASEKTQNAQKIISWIYVIISVKIVQVHCHGRLIEPPSRASMWRYGFDTPPNYNDHELYCGGLTRQWQTNGGKCGICGDPWDAPQPRPHEAGGKYGQGIIVRKYKTGSAFTIRVELTANHKGYFEFRLCPNNTPKKVATQQCLDKYVLKRAKPTMKESEENQHETRYYPGPENKVFEMKYLLPSGLTCNQCVLQWRYFAANNWGMCANGTGAIGCGHQEEFRSCADVAITDMTGGADSTPFHESTTKRQDETTEKEKAKEKETTKAKEEETTPSVHENEIPADEGDEKLDPKATHAKADDYVVYLVSIMGCSLLVVIMLFVLLYFYYYHANDVLRKWWKNGASGLRNASYCSAIKSNIRSCSKDGGKGKGNQKKDVNEQKSSPPPLPPPRTKKYSIGFVGVPENLV